MDGVNDIRLAFDQVPELYERIRPGYPDELFDLLFDTLPAKPAILEVGPGTGQATAGLIERGAEVTAVEIGPRLAAALEDKFQQAPALRVLNSSFETAELPISHFDAVFSATAYHWFEPSQRLERPHQLLKPTGVLAIIDLIQVDSASDRGYFDRVQPIYNAFGDSRHESSLPTYETAAPSIAQELKSSSLFVDIEVHRVPWDQTYTAAEYRDLLLTYSGTQMMPLQPRNELVTQLVSVIDEEFDGTIIRPLVATLTLARPNQ